MPDSYEYPFDTAQDLRSVKGPTFLGGLPNAEDWQRFLDNIEDQKAISFTNLWYAKASKANGVPLRKDFSFEEFVRYGRNLLICKLNDDGKWLTTFCGSKIVEHSGLDPTGKILDDFETSETLEFWLENLRHLTQAHQPVIEFHKLESSLKKYINCTAVNFPLRSETGAAPTMFVGYEFYNSEKF